MTPAVCRDPENAGEAVSQPCNVPRSSFMIDGVGGLITWIIVLVAAFFVLVVLAVFARYFRLWIQSVTTGAGHRHLRPAGHDLPQGQPDGDRPQQDHGGAGRAGRRDGHHQQGAGGPLPGRRQRAAGDPRADRRQQGQDDRARLQAGHGHRPGRPQRAGSGADQRLSQGDRLPGARLGTRLARRASPRTAFS